MSKKDTQANKALLAVIAVLIAGLVYLGFQVNSLKKEVADLSSKKNPVDVQNRLPAPAINPSQQSSGSIPGDPFKDDWDPFVEIDRIRKEMDRMFRDSFGRGQTQFGLFREDMPFDLQTDIRETKSGYIIKMDIPGMDKAKINVEVKDNMLLVSGERDEFDEESKQNQFYKRERSFGYFSRKLPLPDDVNVNAITAQYNKGVLTIKIAKKEGAEPEEKELPQKVNVE